MANDSEVKLKITSDSTQFVADLAKAKKGINDLSSGMMSLSSLASKAGGVLGAYLSVGYVKELAEMGAKALQAETGFRNATDALSIDAKEWVDALKRATKGTVDESDLMQKAMKGISGGLSQDQITKLAEISTTAAVRMGMDVSEAYNDIIDAVEMMRTKTLVKFGLITKAQAEVADEAKRAGVEVDMFRIIAENAANQKNLIGALDETSLAFQRAKAASKDFWESLGKELAHVIGQAYDMATIIKNLFSKEGRQRNQQLADEKLSRMAMDASYAPGPHGSANEPLKTPYIDTLKDATARKKAADEAKRQAEMIQKVVDSLKFQGDQLARLDRDQAIYNALKQAGVTIDSKQGQQIADLAGKNYDYAESIKETKKEAEAMAKNIRDNADERERLLAGIEKELVALEQETAIFGMTTKDAALYKLAVKGATEEQLAFAEALLTTTERMESVKKINEELLSPQEKYNARVKELKEYLDSFAITWDQYRLGMERAKDELDSAAKDQKDKLTDLQRAIEGWGKESADAIVEFALKGKGSFSDMAESILADMMKMLIYQQMLKPLFDSISSSMGGTWFSGLFGGGKASGGFVSPGKMYEVNERGIPELLSVGNRHFLMMAGESGKIAAATAANAGGGSLAGGVDINVNVTNNNGSQITTNTRQTNQGMEIDVMIDNAVASKLSTFGSASNKAIRQNYSASQRLTRR